MSENRTRADALASEFEEEQQRLIDLIEPLTPEQWAKTGGNFPTRINDEDELRPVGVIAHHVADSAAGIMERTRALAAGETPAAVADFNKANAEHAAANAGVSKDEVVKLLVDQKRDIAERLRTFSDAQLEHVGETPVGPMSVADRTERVLLGHLRMHRGSIETALREN